MGATEDEKVAERKWGTQIGSFSKRHNLKRSPTGLKEALWGVQENNDVLKEEDGHKLESLNFVPIH